MRKNIIIIFIFLFLSCGSNEKKTQNCTSSVANFELLNEIDYFETILPIFQSNTDGRIYKCTVCHSWMLSNEPDVAQGEAIIKVLNEKTMPPVSSNFTPFSSDDLALVKDWYQRKIILKSEILDKNKANNSEDAKVNNEKKPKNVNSQSSKCNSK